MSNFIKYVLINTFCYTLGSIAADAQSITGDVMSIGQNAYPRSSFDSIIINHAPEIGSYAFEHSKIQSFMAGTIDIIRRNAFAWADQIGVFCVDKLGTLEELSFEHANISSWTVKNLGAITGRAFPYSQISALDINSVGDMSKASYAFEHIKGLEHLGLPYDNNLIINRDCFNWCDLSLLQSMSIYCKQDLNLQNFEYTLVNSGFGQNSSYDNLRVINVVIDSNRLLIDTNFPKTITNLCENINLCNIFSGIHDLNIYLRNSVPLSSIQDFTKPKLCSFNVALYSGTPSTTLSQNPNMGLIGHLIESSKEAGDDKASTSISTIKSYLNDSDDSDLNIEE